jgi:transposase InsO family protein
MDVKRLGRFKIPGHRITGDGRKTRENRGAGYDHLHCVVDDHSCVAYVELHGRENAETNAGTLERALSFFSELGLGPPDAVMTDNAFVYKNSRRFKEILSTVRARHIVTPPYTPRWNGKVERFIGTLQQEWAYARRWESSGERARALPSFVRYYNRARPHSSLGDRPPISRVHNVRG